jgi:hypothetical protein
LGRKFAIVESRVSAGARGQRFGLANDRFSLTTFRLDRFPIARQVFLAVVVLCWMATVTGCGTALYRLKTRPPRQIVPNPMALPPAEDTFVWLQVVDVVDDYFRIRSEQPVQNRGETVLDGRLETSYKVGASISEPWRKDSTDGFERLQSTLQSIRRRAFVFVRPVGAGYEIEVVVQKELEDTDRSLDATEGAVVARENTVSRSRDRNVDGPMTLGWIPLGRDASLEQTILQDILGRVTQPDRRSLGHH